MDFSPRLSRGCLAHGEPPAPLTYEGLGATTVNSYSLQRHYPEAGLLESRRVAIFSAQK